jgi:aspartyl-tRNA(Asn)/glutamyl-tRNA(Gln) amidotransferase subunit B
MSGGVGSTEPQGSGGVGSTEPQRSADAGLGGSGAGVWEAVIGLEIHVQLKTRTKMFCRCRNGFGGGPNTQTCPVCLAFPGALPVPNRRAIEETIKLGLALDCRIADRAVFHRKNYFYPDLPKGYQISQYDEPLCAGGRLVVPTADGDVTIGITRAHLEEDAAKNVHVAASGRLHGATATLVDFNRGGSPLVEIVTEPDIHDAETAKRFLQLLRQTVVELDLSDAELEKGSMRFDVNVSVRPAGSAELRTRTELKNMNSFNFAAKGIEREIARQVAVYEAGGEVQQETLHFVPGDEESPPSRSKEEAEDYRYFPEPDLVPVHPEETLVARLRGEIGELPGARIRRIADTLSFYDADVLVTGGLDRLWSALVASGADPKEAANVLSNQFVAVGVDPAAVDAAELAKLVGARSQIPRAAFDEALARAGDAGFSAGPYLEQKLVADAGELDPVIDRIIEANPGQAEQFRSGKQGLLGFFVGQVMKEMGGTADPRVVNERVRAKLTP